MVDNDFKSAASFLYVSNMEKHVLGAAISTTDTLQFVLEHMKPEYFYDKIHADIMQVLIDLASESKIPDLLIVVERLRKKSALGAIGLPYIADMASSYYVMHSQLEEHCNIIKQYYFRRCVVEINQKYAIEQMEQETDPIESYTNQQQDLLNLMQEVKAVRADTLDNGVSMVRQQVDNAADGIVPTDILSTGLKALDKIIVGLFPTDFILIGARPSMGKTALVLSIIMHVCRAGKPVRLYSLEMTMKQIVARLAAMISGISYEFVKRGNLSRSQQALFNKALDEIAKWKLYIDDRAGLNPMAIRATSMQDKSSGKDIELIIVDYIQLMDVGKHQSNRNVGVGIASTALKILAKDVNVPVIALSQLSRAVDTRPGSRPQLSDLRDSGSLEQDADMIMFLYRPEQYGMMVYDDERSTIGVAELNIAKNRNGQLGLAMLKFIKEITRFTDLEDSVMAEYNEGENFDNPF